MPRLNPLDSLRTLTRRVALRPELTQSWWLLLTFTLGFLNWAAFYWVGLRTNTSRWVAWGGLYLVPPVAYLMAHFATSDSSLIVDITWWLMPVTSLISIVHGIWIRPSYLNRLRSPRSTATWPVRLAENAWAIPARGEAVLDGHPPVPDWSVSRVPPAVSHPAAATNRRGDRRPAAADPPPDDPIDVNEASVAELSAIPMIGPRLAHHVIELRVALGRFESIEDFGQELGLKPSDVEQLRAYIKTASRRRIG
jgi:hypothetical protein